MSLRRASAWALIAPLVLGVGCGRLREKQAVRRYAMATHSMERQAKVVRALGPALEGHRSSPETAALGRFLRERYLPALKDLVERIRRLPTPSSRLTALRAALLAPAEQALEATESLADRAGVGPLETAWERAHKTREAFEEAVRAHQAALDALCARHDLRRGSP